MTSSQKTARQQGRRAACLALISGYVDSYALVKFGVYASFMTGNRTSAGVHAGLLPALLLLVLALAERDRGDAGSQAG